MYRIAELRKKKKLSQREFGRLIGAAQNTVCNWENGKREPDAQTLNKISAFFNVSVDYLLGNDVSPQQKPLTDKDGLTARDNRDIAKDMERIKEKLLNKEDGPASFDGENISDESAELLLTQIESMLRTIKVINKEKYNPYKNKAGDTHGNSH